MHFISFAKGALAAFWILAILNVIRPMGVDWYWPINLTALALIVVHLGEAALLHKRIQTQSHPWLARAQILLFGVLHLPELKQNTLIPAR